MVKISEQDVEKTAKLAMLALSTREITDFTQALQAKQERLAILKKINTAGLEPLIYILSQKNVFREDQMGQCLGLEEVHANNTVVENGCFQVPRII